MNTSNILRISGIILLISIAFSSCKKDCFAIKGKGSVISQNYVVPAFNAISNSIAADIYLTPDSLHSVSIEAQSNIHEILSIKVVNNELQIGYTKNCGSIKHENIKIYISVPSINSIQLSGSGNVQTTAEFITTSLDMRISGSGSITAAIQAQSFVNGRISGSGDLFLSGNTISENFKISGSGNVRSFAMHSLTSDIEISGSGNADVSAENELSASISGSGDIRYHGNPSINSSISGSGSVNHFP
jgi:hypothetical protein